MPYAGAKDAEGVEDTGRQRETESIAIVHIVNTSYLYVHSVIKSMFHVLSPSDSKETVDM